MNIPEVNMSAKGFAWTGIGVALFMFIGDLGDLVAEYQNWEFVSTNQFIGEIFKLIAGYGAAAMGGASAMSRGD